MFLSESFMDEFGEHKCPFYLEERLLKKKIFNVTLVK